MNKVLIIGCPGAGKSTAAKSLAMKTGLPLINLDQHYWLPGWVPTDETAWHEKVLALSARPRWIMDGNYGSTLRLRSLQADTVIHLDYPTWLCLWRVVQRTVVNFGHEREGQPIRGCPERVSYKIGLGRKRSAAKAGAIKVARNESVVKRGASKANGPKTPRKPA